MPDLPPISDPKSTALSSASIELIIEARPRDLGGFAVRRALPSVLRRLVGPFIFFDHMGPAVLPIGDGFDVRPHPHIALATVTYLFEGEILHRDSLGTTQAIRPGDVNWMIAGRGIVHSERSHPEHPTDSVHLHGIQSWVALPLEHEETFPKFEHHPSRSLPVARIPGAVFDVIAGSAFGMRSPVGVLSPTLYVHARVDAGTRWSVDDEHEERAVYLVEGSAICDGRILRAGTMAILRSGERVNLECREPSRIMLLGGAKLEGERHIFWNFVSSSEQRLEQAKVDWKEGRFPKVPGDDKEFIPLPESG